TRRRCPSPRATPTPRRYSFPTRRSSDLTARSAATARDRSERYFRGDQAMLNFPDAALRPASPAQLRRKAVAPRKMETESRFIGRSEEHTSELQSPDHLVCRLLLEKKKTQ